MSEGVEWCKKDVTAADLMERKLMKHIGCYHYVSDTWTGLENRVGELKPSQRHQILAHTRSLNSPCILCVHNTKAMDFIIEVCDDVLQ